MRQRKITKWADTDIAIRRPRLLGMYVHQVREGMGLSVDQLARVAHIDVDDLNDIERGKKNSLEPETMDALEHALGLAQGFLRLTRSEPEPLGTAVREWLNAGI